MTSLFGLITSKQKGDATEKIAENYLLQHGLEKVTNNFHSKHGEIDLVMKDGEYLVFVEVKFRKSQHFGGAIATISPSKQQKLKLCAAFYMQQQQLNEYNTPCRFDVVALQGKITEPQITWLKNAF
ncbi:MAG: YraN family protein [Pseudoalteromonas spongiae]